MEEDNLTPELEHAHDREAIRERLAQPYKRSYLRDAIYGAIDGAVTTFAVVSGVSGAGLSPSIVIILGVANLVGDGFSMAAGNYLGIRAENGQRDRLEAMERRHIALCADGEIEEIRQILSMRGYKGKLLDDNIAHLTSDKDAWVSTMMQFEHGLDLQRSAPLPAALATFFSFLVVGFLPLAPFVFDWLLALEKSQWSFVASTVMTAIAFATIGAIKSRYVDEHWFWSALETLFVGGLAAGLAYLCGYGLSQLGGI